MADRFRSVAVAIDGSAHGVEALSVAIDVARHYGGRLTILSVVPVPATIVLPNEPIPTAWVGGEGPRYRALVDAAVEQARKEGLTAVEGVCEEGGIVDAILGHLENHPADLLVVGSRGLSAAKRLLLGSVSTALVNRAPCPVLVVRPVVTKPEG
jgi:nucleotide-binding universal stress UspA family protein